MRDVIFGRLAELDGKMVQDIYNDFGIKRD